MNAAKEGSISFCRENWELRFRSKTACVRRNRKSGKEFFPGCWCFSVSDTLFTSDLRRPDLPRQVTGLENLLSFFIYFIHFSALAVQILRVSRDRRSKPIRSRSIRSHWSNCRSTVRKSIRSHKVYRNDRACGRTG
jgi:hypothetical protein